MIVLIIALVVGLAWAGKRLADEKVESALADYDAQQSARAADFNDHVDDVLAMQDPATPHLGWPAGVVPLRPEVYRAHHDRRGGAR